MTDVNVLGRAIQSRYSAWISMADIAFGELTLHVKKEYLISLCQSLRDEAEFDFNFNLNFDPNFGYIKTGGGGGCGTGFFHYN